MFYIHLLERKNKIIAIKRKPLRFTDLQIVAIKVFIHVLAIGFVGNMLYLTITDKIAGDPVDALLHFSGIGSLHFLLLCLLVSPTAKFFKAAGLIRIRRLLGLYAFFYACLHLLSFVFFELQLEWGLILTEIVDRPFITVGFVAWLLLLSLTLTSTKGIQRRMGRRWQSLHNWIYMIAPLIVIHFYWSVKSNIFEPILYAVALTLLLWLRKDKILKLIGR